MTKKDYVLIAKSFKEGMLRFGDYKDSRDVLKIVTLSLAIRMQTENPLFNREKFLSACGITE